MAGVTGGVIAGICKDIPDAILGYFLKISRITFWDYSGTIALGHRPKVGLEVITAIFYEVVFSIFIGIIFVYLAPYFKTKRYLLRGAIYGALVWFFIRAAVMAFRLEPLIDGDIISAVINSLNSIFYGLILGAIVHYLDKKRQVYN